MAIGVSFATLILLSIVLFEAIFVLMVVTWAVRKSRGRGDTDEETGTIQEMYETLSNLSARVETLEAVLIEKQRNTERSDT